MDTNASSRRIARWSSIVLAVVTVLTLAPRPAAGQAPATDDVIKFYQMRAAREPGAFPYAKLGAAYVQKARESGDITYYDLAEKALARALELRPDPSTAAGVTTLLALVQYARHDFQEALRSAQRAVAWGSSGVFAYTLIGDASVELGDYERADEAYAKLLHLTGPAHPHSRLAYLRFLRGDPGGAIAAMERAVETVRGAEVPRENVAWTEFSLADLWFQVGQLDRAEAACRDALASYPGYHRALAGLARVQAARGRYPESAALYQRALGVIPLPEYAAALGDVLWKLGQRREAQKQYDLVEYIGRLNAVNRVVHNRELAMFLADHDLKPGQALELARRELEVRRDVYTHDVLAWALYRNGRLQEALAEMTEALRLGTRDARLFFHAGLIHHALGQAEPARRYLEQALATNPYFHVLQADVARDVLVQLSHPGGLP
jgi:tetratricopeptide (TPR) repeat protein